MADMDVIIGVDASEVDAGLRRAMLAVTALDDTLDDVEDKRQEVDRAVKESERAHIATYRRTLMQARQVNQIVRGLAVAAGDSFSEIYATGMEIAFVTAELLIDVAAAESLTLVGAVNAAAKIALIFTLMKKVQLLRQGKTEAAARTEGIISALTAVDALTQQVY